VDLVERDLLRPLKLVSDEGELAGACGGRFSFLLLGGALFDAARDGIAAKVGQALEAAAPRRRPGENEAEAMRHSLELLDDDRRAGLVGLACEEQPLVREALLAHGDEDGRGVLPEVFAAGERRDERVHDGVGVGVYVDPRGRGGPEVVFGEGPRVVERLRRLRVGPGLAQRQLARRRVEVVELGVGDDGGHGARHVAPGREDGDARGQLDRHVAAVEADGRGDAAQGEQRLQQHEAQVTTGGVAREDDLVRGNGRMERSWRRMQDREINHQGVNEGRREGVLGGKTVADGEDGGAGQLGDARGGLAVRARVHQTK